MPKETRRLWIVVTLCTIAASMLFALILYPHPQPLDAQLRDFARIADSDDRWHEGVIQHGAGNHIAAMKLYSEAIAIRDDSKMAYLYRGTLHYDQGHYAEAIADYTQALRIDPVFTWALNARGVAHYRHGDLQAAQADFEQSQQLDPDFIGPEVNQALIKTLASNSPDSTP